MNINTTNIGPYRITDIGGGNYYFTNYQTGKAWTISKVEKDFILGAGDAEAKLEAAAEIEADHVQEDLLDTQGRHIDLSVTVAE